MCDTMLVRPGFTKSVALLFAKNSDREANEAQYLQHVPRASHPAGLKKFPEIGTKIAPPGLVG